MKARLYFSLIVAVALSGTALLDCLTGVAQKAWAQPPGGSSRSESGRDSDRDHSRSRFGDRSRGDFRGRSHDDERRDDRRREDRSSSSSSGSSSSGSSSSGSSRSSGSGSSSASTSSTTPSSSSPSSSGSNDRLKKWATELVTKNDKNGDMILDKDEQAALGSSAASEDLNHDGKITIDEIVMHHSAGSSTTPATSSSGSSSGSSTDSGRSSSGDSRSKTSDALAKRVLTGTAGGTGKDADKRRSYRFSKAADKLPSGLPAFFSRDTNHDGQVSLSEYSRSMSSSVVAEFRRYDLNDDGVVTAKEATSKK